MFDTVANHYTHGHLLEAINAGVECLGKSPDTVSVEDLGPVDEFHIGGREATENFLNQLDLSPDDHVLDVGCGLGGPSRFTAQRFGSRVTGINLTAEYIDTGRTLCSWVGLNDRITLEQAVAVATTFPDAAFDKVYMMHVGLNIADKQQLFAELRRILRPGGYLGIYDVMRMSEDDLLFPVPWAATAAVSVVESPDVYKEALSATGFRVVTESSRREFAMDFFDRLQASAGARENQPPLGLHILMGEMAPMKIKNMIENVAQNRVAPVELIAETMP